MRLRAILACVGLLALTACGVPLAAADGTHTLYVDGTGYPNTHEAGSTFHWEAPNVPLGTAVTFPERGQEWTGQGYEDCESGIAHWVSNDNNLVQSGCVDEPDDSTTTSTSTTSTSTTTTLPRPPGDDGTTTTTTTTATTTTQPGQTTTTTVPAQTTTTTVPAQTTTTAAPGLPITG
jgi:hypothetical protein